jgi:hypothetical protein
MAKVKANGHGKKGALHLYRTYMFKDKDPVIDRIRTIMRDEGISERDLHIVSGVSTTTFHNWFKGETMKPQYATVAASVSAMGYKQEFVKEKKIDFVKEVAKAQKEIEQAAKAKGK